MAFVSSRVALAALGAALWLGVQPSPGNAAAPLCHVHGSGGYCQYDGKVSIAYMNAYDQVLLYFDTPLDPAQPASVGLNGVTYVHYAIYNMAGNKDFGKSLFAALLAAQARGANVRVQMHSVSGGYLVMDRIWVME